MPPRAFCSSFTWTWSRGKRQRLGDVVADPYRERLAERALVAEAGEVQLQRLRLEAERVRLVRDRRPVEIGLSGDRAHRRQLVARHLDLRDAGVRERLEPGVVLGARMPERHEFACVSVMALL